MGSLCSHEEQNISSKPNRIKKQSEKSSNKLDNEKEPFAGHYSSSLKQSGEQNRGNEELEQELNVENESQLRKASESNEELKQESDVENEPQLRKASESNEELKQESDVENKLQLRKALESIEETVGQKKGQNRLEMSSPGKIFVETWWFYTLDWPPQKHDFNAELERRSLRKVELEDWESACDIDQDGRRKVFEVPLHRGLFQDSQGRILDLKPRKECKIYQTLKTKSRSELLKLYQKAIEHEFKRFNKKLDKMEKVFARTNQSAKNFFPYSRKNSKKDLRAPSPSSSPSHSHSSLFETWWFWCLEWPMDSDYDWEKRLKISRWRVVSLNNWERESLRDENGFVKAFEVPLHPKVYENAFAGLLNCKPNGIAVNYVKLKSKSFYELLKLYEVAMSANFNKFKEDYAEILSEPILLERI